MLIILFIFKVHTETIAKKTFYFKVPMWIREHVRKHLLYISISTLFLSSPYFFFKKGLNSLLPII